MEPTTVDKLAPGVLGYDDDGNEVREPIADASIWTLQVKRLTFTPGTQPHENPRGSWNIVANFDGQKLGPPDVDWLAVEFGPGRYEWKIRTTKAMGGNIRYVRRGEFSGVPDHLPVSGQFTITPDEAARARGTPTAAEVAAARAVEPAAAVGPQTPTPAVSTVGQTTLTPDMIAEAVGRALSAQRPGDSGNVAAEVQRALREQRSQDLGAEVSALREKVSNVEKLAAELKSQLVTREKFESFETYTRGQLGKVDEWGRDQSDTDKRVTALADKVEKAQAAAAAAGQRPDISTELERIEATAKRLGYARESAAAPQAVGRTGLDVAAELGTRGVELLQGFAAKHGVIDPNAIENRGQSVGRVNWRTYDGGKMAHLGPYLERLADDMAGEVSLPIRHFVTDAVLRLKDYPAEAEMLISYKPPEVRGLLEKVCGKSHPLVKGWTADDEATVEAFQLMFAKQLQEYRDAVKAAREAAREGALAQAGRAGQNGGTGAGADEGGNSAQTTPNATGGKPDATGVGGA